MILYARQQRRNRDKEQTFELCETLWIAAHQAPLSMGFSRQEYCIQADVNCPLLIQPS